MKPADTDRRRDRVIVSEVHEILIGLRRASPQLSVVDTRNRDQRYAAARLEYAAGASSSSRAISSLPKA